MEKNRSPDSLNKRRYGGFIKTFFAGFLVCGAGIDLLDLFIEGATSWALNQLLVKAVGSAIASVLTLVIKPIFKIFLETKGGAKVKKFFKKVGAFFARVGKYLKSNKITLGGIITSIITGAIGTSVTVCGYTFDVISLIDKIPQLSWVKDVSINGFNLTPIIAGVIIWLIAVWNGAAAVKRGWESPEQYEAVKASQAAVKQIAAQEAEPSTSNSEENPNKEGSEMSAEEIHARRVAELKEKLKTQ